MNKIEYEKKLSCMLFGCPMIEELKSCSISNLRVLTSNLPFLVEEKEEKFILEILIAPKFLCLANNK